MSSNAVTLRQVKHFLTLAEELNFSRAAERCSIAQPPFSRSIQCLEAALQARLVERRPRGVELTHSGRVFADESRGALAALRHAGEHARAAQRTASRLRIGMLEYVDAILGSGLIDAFAQAHPKPLVEPMDAPPEHMAFSLIHGVLDLQFAALSDRTRLPARSGLRQLALHEEPLAALVDDTHRLARPRVAAAVSAARGQR